MSESLGTCILAQAAMYALVVPGTAPLFTVTFTPAILPYDSVRYVCSLSTQGGESSAPEPAVMLPPTTPTVSRFAAAEGHDCHGVRCWLVLSIPHVVVKVLSVVWTHILATCSVY